LFPVSGIVSAELRYDVALTGSVFRAEDLPEEFVRRRMWRRSVAVGVRVGM
jgi:hypothetical protein